MLIIRDRQLRVLARAALSRWLMDHLKRCFPEDCRRMSDADIRGEIRYGIDRAVAYAFTTEVLISKYLDLMFSLGRDFDKDPALDWVAPILNDGSEAESRMERLVAAALEHLRGPAAWEQGA